MVIILKENEQPLLKVLNSKVILFRKFLLLVYRAGI